MQHMYFSITNYSGFKCSYSLQIYKLTSAIYSKYYVHIPKRLRLPVNMSVRESLYLIYSELFLNSGQKESTERNELKTNQKVDRKPSIIWDKY